MSKADDDHYEDDFEEERHGDSARGPVPTAAPAPTPAYSAAPAPASRTSDAGSRADESSGWAPVDPAEVEIGSQLGGGGFAVVYRGTYRGAGVAVKMIVDPHATAEQLSDFMAELNTMAAVSGHRNIVRLIGASPSPPRQCIVMELCRGTLFDVLHGSWGGGGGGGLSLRVAWAQDVARAIAFLHGRRPAIIHRDVKSQNCLIGGDGAIKLTDFGISTTRITAAGTPSYMAPELLAEKPYSKAADTYAFGVLLWELLARRIPFAGWRAPDIRDAVIRGTRPDLSSLPLDTPGPLRDLITACWAPAGAERPPMESVVERLGDALRGLPPLPSPGEQAALVAAATGGGGGGGGSGGGAGGPPRRGSDGPPGGGRGAAAALDALDALAISTKPKGAKK